MKVFRRLFSARKLSALAIAAALGIGAEASAPVGDSVADTLVDIPNFGGIRDTGDPARNRELEIYSSGPVVEWSLQHNRDPNISGVMDNYRQGEVQSGGSTAVTFSHHT